MKNLKRVLGGAIALAVLCSITSFNGLTAEAKEVPKYLKDDTTSIYGAYMYGDKALTITESGKVYYDKKIQKSPCFNDSLSTIKISKKYVYATDYKEHVIFNIEDGSKKDGLPMLEKMNKDVAEKYNLGNIGFTTTAFLESDTDVFWSQFDFATKDGKEIRGLVSSNGDIIELPFTEKDMYEVTMHNNKAYVLYEEKGQYDVKVYSVSEKESNLCTIAKESEKDELSELVINKDDDMYIIDNGEKDLKKGQKEISKINVNDGKATLTTIVKYNYERTNVHIRTVAVDTNKNIWYLQDGLIYKIENDKPVLKYEVQKNKNNLFVGDDNNLIVSGNEYDSGAPINNPYNNGKSTIINLSNEHENGWVEENHGWTYYENRQVITDDWKNIDGKWYYFGIDGQMLQGWMNNESGNVYYLNTQGDAAIGWKKINNSWYYFNNSAEMVTGWVNTDGKWYYLNVESEYPVQKGFMVVGWRKIDGQWYYMDNSGVMETGWKQIDGSWYYMYSNGTMAHDTTIDGYKIGSNGAML